MKKTIIKIIFFIVIVVPYSSEAFESEITVEEKGLYGTIISGAGIASIQRSLLSTGSSEYISTLNLQEKTDAEIILIPEIDIELGYKISSTDISVSTTISEEVSDYFSGFNFSITVSQSLGVAGLVSVELDFSMSEVWKDPYLAGEIREITDSSNTGVDITYDEIFKLPVSINWGYVETDVKNDVAGSGSSNLRRDGYEYSAGVDIPAFSFGKNRGLVSYSYLNGVYKGRSNSFEGQSISFMHELDMTRWTLSTCVTHEIKDYKAVHPVFNKKREDTEYSLMTELIYNEPFGNKGWFVSMTGATGWRDSNIYFFEESGSFIGCSAGYNL